MVRFGRRKNFKTTNGFATIPVQQSVETVDRFGRRKKFEKRDGFPTVPMEKALKLWRGLLEEKSLKQRMDFQ